MLLIRLVILLLIDSYKFDDKIALWNNLFTFFDIIINYLYDSWLVGGNKYIWTNKRYRNMHALILERLDRCRTIDY